MSHSPTTLVPTLVPARGDSPAWLDLVRQKVEHLSYGQVYIVVHDHRVTQIECLEKVRLGETRARPASPTESAA